jgi:hypothetical protein
VIPHVFTEDTVPLQYTITFLMGEVVRNPPGSLLLVDVVGVEVLIGTPDNPTQRPIVIIEMKQGDNIGILIHRFFKRILEGFPEYRVIQLGYVGWNIGVFHFFFLSHI